MAKAKRPGVALLKRKADSLFSTYIRLRDADKDGKATCITCGVKKYWKDMQAGHFVKRSVSQLRYDEENVNAQCMQCNIWKYGEQYAYAQALDLKYGEGTAEKLHQMRFSTHKFTTEELLQIIHDAKEYIAWYEANK